MTVKTKRKLFSFLTSLDNNVRAALFDRTSFSDAERTRGCHVTASMFLAGAAIGFLGAAVIAS